MFTTFRYLVEGENGTRDKICRTQEEFLATLKKIPATVDYVLRASICPSWNGRDETVFFQIVDFEDPFTYAELPHAL